MAGQAKAGPGPKAPSGRRCGHGHWGEKAQVSVAPGGGPGLRLRGKDAESQGIPGREGKGRRELKSAVKSPGFCRGRVEERQEVAGVGAWGGAVA